MNTTYDKHNGFASKPLRPARQRKQERQGRRDWSQYGFMPTPIERALIGTIGRPFA